MSLKTPAAIYVESGKPMVIDDIDLPDPGPTQVSVRHFATGVCHSQLHELNRPNPTLPLVLGHESTGIVTAALQARSDAWSTSRQGGAQAWDPITGVGAANRAQIEKVFFRAITQVMPNNANLRTAADAVIQAAVDLYGESSAATQAVTQAMVAVGLR